MSTEYQASYIVEQPAGTFIGVVLYGPNHDPMVHARKAWGTAATIFPYTRNEYDNLPTVYLNLLGR